MKVQVIYMLPIKKESHYKQSILKKNTKNIVHHGK